MATSIANITNSGANGFPDMRGMKTGPSSWKVVPGLQGTNLSACTSAVIEWDGQRSSYSFYCRSGQKTQAVASGWMSLAKAGVSMPQTGWVIRPTQSSSPPVVAMFEASHPRWPGARLAVVEEMKGGVYSVVLVITTPPMPNTPQTASAIQPTITIAEYSHMMPTEKGRVIEQFVTYIRSFTKGPREKVNFLRAYFDPDPANPKQTPWGYLVFDHTTIEMAEDHGAMKIWDHDSVYFGKLYEEIIAKNPNLSSQTDEQQLTLMRGRAQEEYQGAVRIEQFMKAKIAEVDQKLETAKNRVALIGTWKGSYSCPNGGGNSSWEIHNPTDTTFSASETWFHFIQGVNEYTGSLSADGVLTFTTEGLGGYTVTFTLSADKKMLTGRYAGHPNGCRSVTLYKQQE